MCQRVIAGKFSSNDLISLLSVLEAPVMYAMSISGCAICQRGSGPTRIIRTTQTARSSRSLDRFSRSCPADFSSSWFWIPTSGAQTPFSAIVSFAGEPACYLGGCTDKGRCRVVDGALFLWIVLSGSPGWRLFLALGDRGGADSSSGRGR